MEVVVSLRFGFSLARPGQLIQEVAPLAPADGVAVVAEDAHHAGAAEGRVQRAQLVHGVVRLEVWPLLAVPGPQTTQDLGLGRSCYISVPRPDGGIMGDQHQILSVSGELSASAC